MRATMRALVLDRPGGLEQLRLTELARPEPGPDEIRVRVRAVGLNPVDYQLAASGFPGWRYPFVLGLDVAGVVDAVGANVTSWRVGAAVYYHGDLSKPGGYAEFALVKAHVVAPLPAGATFVEAAALPCAGFSAYQALFRKLHVQPGQSILIQGGAGGVGGFAVQLAAMAGLRVITTCSGRNAEHVRRLGAHEVIDYTREDLASRIRDLTAGRGVAAIVDTLGPQSATAGLELLAFGGGIVCVAGLLDCSRIQPFTKALSVHEVALGAAHLSGDVAAQRDLAAIGQDLGRLLANGKLTAMVAETVTLDQVPGALSRLAERHVCGKIVVQLGGESE